MIVREVITTGLGLVTPDNTLGHAANLLRQHQFHICLWCRCLQKSLVAGHPTTLAQYSPRNLGSGVGTGCQAL